MGGPGVLDANCVVTAGAWLFAAAVLAKEPRAVALHWSAPAECPSAEGFEGDVRRLTAEAIPIVPSAAHRVSVEIAADANGFSAVISSELGGDLAAAPQRRELSAADCDSLARAVGLVVAVSLAPLKVTRTIISATKPAAKLALEAPEPTPFPAAASVHLTEPSPPRAAVDATRTQPVPRSTPRRESRVTLGATTGLGLGVVPSASVVLRAAVGWHGERFHLRLGGEHWFPRSEAVPGARVGIRASGGNAAGCYALVVKPVEVPVCLETTVLAVRAAGEGAGVTSRPTTGPWVGTGPSVGVVVRPQRRIALTAGVGTRVAIFRPKFHLARAGEIVPAFRSEPISLTVSVGIELRLP